MQSRSIWIVVVISGGLAFAGWHYRDFLLARVFPKATPEPTATVMYSWTDKEGVVHFSQEKAKGRGKALVVDTAHITPVDEVKASPFRVKPVANEPAAPGTVAADQSSPSSQQQGEAGGPHELMQLRQELHQNGQKIRKRMMEQGMGEENYP